MAKWDSEKESLENLINEGVSYEEIGRIYGCTGANIKKQAKNLGIRLCDRRKINPDETFNRGKYKKFCRVCGKPIPNKHGKYCSKECENVHRYNTLVQKWKNGEINGCDKSGTPREFLKRYLFEKNNGKCENCGFDKTNIYTGLHILQIHHIDGDCFNNREENLQFLCPNCHHLTENFGSRNKNATRTDKRTKYYRDLILNK